MVEIVIQQSGSNLRNSGRPSTNCSTENSKVVRESTPENSGTSIWYGDQELEVSRISA